MEIDVRKKYCCTKDISIRWSDNGVITDGIGYGGGRVAWLKNEGAGDKISVKRENISCLIEALKKYQELYGE